MALAESLPYGLRDIRLTPVSSTGVLGTPVDLPNGRTLSYEETEDFETLRGDDRDVASRGKGPQIGWELESGGISLEAYAVLNGGTVTLSGTTPNQIKSYNKKVTDQRPEFKCEGQAMSESGGDFHTILHRCKATESLAGELADGTFFLTSAKGTALASRTAATVDKMYDFVQNETITAIP